MINSTQHIVYGYSKEFRKWSFVSPVAKFTMLYSLAHLPNKAEAARKIANILGGSVKRCGAVDNLARTNIQKILNDL